MAYNTNTRLLLNFGSSNSIQDTSEYANTLSWSHQLTFEEVGGPFGDRAYRYPGDSGDWVSSPSGILPSASTAACTLDFWVNPGQIETGLFVHVLGLQPSYNYLLDRASYFGLYITNQGDGPELYVDVQTESGEFGEGSYPLNSDTWNHVRVRVETGGWALGINGAEEDSQTIAVFAEATVESNFVLGTGNQEVLIDCVQLLHGDDSWTGGAYTVPTSPPEDYSPGSISTGQGTTLVDDILSQGTGGGWWLGQGTNDVEDVLSSCDGEVYWAAIEGAGSTTLEPVTSATPERYNEKTRLLIKFDDFGALGNDGTVYCHDTSVGARKVYFDLPDGLEHVNTQGVFGSPSMRFGTPAASYTPGRLSVSPCADIFSDVSSSTKRFDLWYRVEANAPIALSALFTVEFANGDFVYLWRTSTSIGLNIKKNGVETSVNGSFTNSAFNVWRHVRVLISGGTVVVAADGAQRATMTLGQNAWPGSSSNPIQSVLFADFPASDTSPSYGFRGCLDAVEWLEGDTSYSGGTYLVPTREPSDFDPWSTSARYIQGANTVDAILSHGEGVTRNREGVGANTVEVVSSSTAKLIAGATGQNNVDNVVASSHAEFGQWWIGAGANTVESVQSTWTIIQIPPRKGSSAYETENVVSIGEARVFDRAAAGNAYLHAITSQSIGYTLGVPPNGVGASNVAAVKSSGTGKVSTLGVAGVQAQDVASAGEGFISFSGRAMSSVSVFGSGEGKALVTGYGSSVANTVGSGEIKFEVFGRGGTPITWVNGSGAAGVSCVGVGESDVDDVRAWFPEGYFSMTMSDFVSTKREDRWVRQ